MKFLNANKSKHLITGLLFAVFLLAGSCQNWMSNDDFMSKIENEVHDANAKPLTVYVRFAHDKMGKTEPSGSTSMKVDVASKVSAVPGDDYGFVKWAAFTTADFPANKNHSELTYISEEAYNQNFKQKEIPSDEVQFSNPTEQVTEVKIKKARNDIFIIPIVAARPAYVQSVPAGGDSNVVKNTSIRILFSKAIDKKTIVDSEGKLNYSITSSAQTFVDDDQEIVANDITDHFDWKLSDSGKMLTLSLKEKLNDKGEKTGEIEWFFDNRQRITITLFEGLCDVYGFSMNGNYTFNFSTGTNIDSLAPMIDVIYGGTGDKCDVFVSFHSGEIDGKATDASKKAPKDITSEEYTDALVAQRIYDKLNLYIAATDIIAAGNKDISFEKEASEDNVNAIGIAASLYIDKDGKPVTIDSTNSIPKQNFVYIPGSIDQNSQLEGMFSDFVPKDYKNLLNLEGTIYTYDLSNLPDGLIKIDIWAVDMTGNSAAPAEDGSPNKSGSPYYTKHDNGYKSIFVVKDTTPPDSAAEAKAKKIISNSAQAPYYWYNSETLSTMQLYDLETNPIVDAGHVKLRSLAKNLSWNFVVGKSDKAPAANDAGWKLIHNQETGAGIKYELNDAKIPEADGPVDITLFIRDDIGNVSAPVVLDSIMYDNTKPVVSLKAGLGDFVDASTGLPVLHASSSDVINQVLKLDFTEENAANNVSGIRRLEIHVKKGDTEVAVPLDADTFKVLYAPASITNPKPTSDGVRTISMAANDAATNNNVKVFDVTDSTKLTSGSLFIYGLTLGTEDGAYNVLVDLYDSALNKSPKTEVTSIARDTTDPVISKVQVMDAKVRKVYGSNEETWWLPADRFETPDSLSKVTLKITASESGSGISTIKLADNAEFTENTKLYVGTSLLAKGTDYTYDAAANTIQLTDWFTPKLINTANETQLITLENIKLNNINAAAGTTQGNKVKVEVTDFVGKSKSENEFYYHDTEIKGSVVYADSIAPQIAVLKVEDSQENTTNNIQNKAYNKAAYTNSQNVVLYLTLGNTETGNKGSGVDKIILTDNAVFTDSTEIYLNSNTSPLVKGANGDYEITTENGKPVVNFKKVFTEAETLKFTNVNISSSAQGNQIIKADVQDFAGIKSVESKPTDIIIFDNVAPVVVHTNDRNDMYWDNLQTGVTAGAEKNMLVDTQSLRIDFTEATAGIKLIKFDIYRQGQSAYGLPFADGNFKLSYKPANAANVTPLEKDTDYEIVSNGTDQNFKQYIKLTNTYTSGSFIFDNLTLSNSDIEKTYFIDVIMLDAAENRVDCQQSIAIDSVAPVITEVLYIPELIHEKELTTSSGSPMIGAQTGNYWLSKELQGNRSGGYAPDSIPVYINVEETNSAVKVIKFLDDVALDSTKTKLYTATSKSDTAGVAVDADKYIVNTTDNTITIKNTSDCLKAETGTFTILVKGVGFKNVDTTTYTSSTHNGASKNVISLKVSDVAMNESEAKRTAEAEIYSDSRAPDAPTNLKLLDRGNSSEGFDANKTTISATEDYTNESVVNMTFSLSDCEKTGSGYHKFEISGAKFTSDTRVIVKTASGNNTIIEATDTSKFVLQDDNTTLVLKSSDAANPQNYVLRHAVNVTFTNIEFTSTTNGLKTVSLTAYDLAGWNQLAVSDSIYFDNTEPVLEKLFTANYTSGPSYYIPSLNVYPHANGENATGVSVDYTNNGETKTIPTFYTATDYVSTRTRYKKDGQVSYSSSTVDTIFEHTIVLGIRAKDENGRVGGYKNGYDKARYKSF